MIIAIVASPIVLGLTSAWPVDWAWFVAIGYVQVFWTIFGARALLFGAVFAASAIIVWVNGSVAYRFARRWGQVRPMDFEREPLGIETLPELLERTRQHLPWRLLLAGVAGVFGLLVAVGEMGNWDVVLRCIYQVPYGHSDPLYGKDIDFYLFSLPAYIALKNWLLVMLVLSVLVAAAVYWVHGSIALAERRRLMPSPAIIHGSALLGGFFVVQAWSYGLDRFLLLYGDNGVVVGASYTDVHAVLPVLRLLVGLALVTTVWILPRSSITVKISGSSRTCERPRRWPRWPHTISLCACPGSRKRSFSSCCQWCRASGTL